jgi:hypothetical protein
MIGSLKEKIFTEKSLWDYYKETQLTLPNLSPPLYLTKIVSLIAL